MLEGINWLGVILAVVAAFALGFAWYTFLFRDAWARGVGLDPSAPGGNPGLAMGMQLLGTVLTAVVLAIFIERFGTGVGTGITVGLLASIGFVATAKMSDVLFSRRASSSVFWIETSNQIASYVLMGAVIGLIG